jgi:transmembrane sensor
MENLDTMETRYTRRSEKELLSGAVIQWNKSKEEALREITAKIGGADKKRVLRRGFSPLTWALAASLLILITGSIFLRFHTTTILTGTGEEKTLNFSDGSVAKLNAESELSYHPFWWKFSRKIRLTGEAYFEVKPGGRFEVLSAQGVTTVLGTRFNILARGNTYEVSCLSGKVKVESAATEDAVILKPDEKAFLNDHGKLDCKQIQELQKQITWIQTEWIFTGELFINVIQIIESLYHTSINLPNDDNHRFTGGFDRSMSLENVLDLVCTPFEYTFTKKAEGGYEIHPK